MFVRRGWLRFLWPVFGAAIALLAVAATSSAAVPAHGRTWELVSAGETHGTQLLFSRAWSGDGEAMVFVSLGPMPGAGGGELLSHNLATRTPSGWRTVPISVPHAVPTASIFGTVSLAISADLSSWLWASVNPLLPGAPASPLRGLYRRGADGSLTLIGSLGPESPFFSPTTASNDLARAGLDLSEAVVPADSGRIAGKAAYEVVGDELRLAGVDESGAPLSPCGSVIGGSEQDRATRRAAMSRDGSRIFLTSPDPSTSACAAPPAVYLREDGAHTIEISASHCSRPDCGPAAAATFAGANDDGSIAYFISAQQLTDDDVDTVPDLYRYDRAAESLTRVSAGPPGTEANVIPPIRVSRDGSRVYFCATDSLVPDQSSEQTSNLYLREGDGPIRYVGNISGQSLDSAAIDADGSTLLFATNVALLVGDTDTAADVYRYDAAGDDLVRISASSGGGDSGNDPANATIPRGEEVFPAQGPNPLSLDGEHAFFLTTEALLAEDENDEADLYEWSGADLGLISPGVSENGRAITYEGASADGSSVFFETRQSLVAEDDDGGEGDLYAARLGGGFPSLPVPPGCAGEACRGPIPGRSSLPLPATVSGTAEGPPAPRRGLGLQLGTRARRLLAGGGRGVAIVRAPAAGRVRLSAFTRIAGRDRLVAKADAIAWHAGRLSVPFRLSADARRLLDQHRRLRLRLVLRHSQVPVPEETVVTLGKSK
jgi:hypothetical protein